MDNLTRDAIAATAAGMSYGRWKVLHPNTNPDRQPEASTIRIDNKVVRCKWCNKEFVKTPKHLVLCSDECKVEYRRKYNREYNIRTRITDYNDHNDGDSDQLDLDKIFETNV